MNPNVNICRHRHSSTSSLMIMQVTFCNDIKNNFEFTIEEDTTCCDGLGGEVWNGALTLTLFLLSHFNSFEESKNISALELGAGSGICSIALSHVCPSFEIHVTDRFVDLIDKNLQLLRQQCNITSQVLEWGDDQVLNRTFDIIFGAEIACLTKQQGKLLKVIISHSHKNSVVYLSFDGFPPKANTYASSAEQQFDLFMISHGFIAQVVYVCHIQWEIDGSVIYTNLSQKMNENFKWTQFEDFNDMGLHHITKYQRK